MDSKIAENRLNTRESVFAFGFGSVPKIGNKLLQLKASCDLANLDSLLKEIEVYQLDMNVVATSLTRSEYDREEYLSIESSLLSDVKEVEQSIQALEAELRHEKIIRKHRDLCEEYGKKVNKHESLASTNKSIELSEEDVIGANENIKLLDRQIERRYSQFNNILSSLVVLKSDIVEEDDGNCATNSENKSNDSSSNNNNNNNNSDSNNNSSNNNENSSNNNNGQGGNSMDLA